MCTKKKERKLANIPKECIQKARKKGSKPKKWVQVKKAGKQACSMQGCLQLTKQEIQ